MPWLFELLILKVDGGEIHSQLNQKINFHSRHFDTDCALLVVCVHAVVACCSFALTLLRSVTRAHVAGTSKTAIKCSLTQLRIMYRYTNYGLSVIS